MTAIGHIAINTADLDRFRRFYDEVFGIRASIVLQMDQAPGFRHAFFPIDDRTEIHVFEVPGYDPAAQGFTDVIGQRGRIDHFGLAFASEAEFEAARGRLVAAGATDGAVTDFGPLRSVYFEDPDGMPCEVTVVVEGYDPAAMPGEQVVEVVDPHWFDRLRNSLATPSAV
jgi:catechol 2,3-dioxygenase-like lactoylglutathione lyase family enzyme